MGNVYEFNKYSQLYGDSSKYFVIPQSFLMNKNLSEKTILVYCYLFIKKGLDDCVFTSIPRIVEWCKYKQNLHAGKINDNICLSLEELKHEGYLTYTDPITKAGCLEIKFNTEKIIDLCNNESFAIIYLDELYRILQYKKDDNANNLSIEKILRVFVFIRNSIFRRSNKLKADEITANYNEDIISRISNMPEAFNSTYKNIGSQMNISEKQVSKSVGILEQLNLIRCFTAYRIELDNGKRMTPDSIFVNYDKRDKDRLLSSGESYFIKEVISKENKMKKFNEKYRIKYKKG